MESVDINYVFFIGGMLLTFAILASKLSSIVGTPLLLLFLAIGMLSGEDGVFIKIVYNDYTSAYYIANLMLALILLDGGLRTNYKQMRSVASESIILATVGVVVTSAITGVAAYMLLDLSLLQALLIGAIVGSTDAAAVFSLLGDGGVNLKARVSATLQIESATNDPMAILLTTILLSLVSGRASSGTDVLMIFATQFGLGVIFGIIFGIFARFAINSINLGAGLYSLFVIGIGLIGFAITASMDGSGFLAVFIIGMFVGNQNTRKVSYILPVGEGITWLAQISLFLMLGLLVSPHNMVHYVVPGTIVAVVMTFLARPVAVLLCLLPMYFRRYSIKDLLFMSFVGLRGSVPIVLAMYPVMDDISNAQLYFNMAFVVVIFSLLVQGACILPVAKFFNVYAPASVAPISKANVGIMLNDDFDLFNYKIKRDSMEGRRLRTLQFPKETAVVAMFRDGHLMKPQGGTQLKKDDILSVIGVESDEIALNAIFSQDKPVKQYPLYAGDKIYDGHTPMTLLAETYNFELTSFEKTLTVAECMSYHLGGFPQPGDFMNLINARLVVVSLEGDYIAKVGLYLLSEIRLKEHRRKNARSGVSTLSKYGQKPLHR